MLSVRKMFLATAPYSSLCASDGTSARYTYRICDKIFHRRYGELVPEKLLYDEEDIEKYKLDPRVKAIMSQIIYSDYIEKKSLRQGAKKNRMVMDKLRYKVKTKRNKILMETPASSIAVKYLRCMENSAEEICRDSAVRPSSESNISENAENTTNLDSRPIHMPYASTDSYEEAQNAESEKNDATPDEIPELNQDYIELYENYLKTKTLKDETSLTRLIKEKTLPRDVFVKIRSGEETNVPPNWMTDYEQYDDFKKKRSSRSTCGTADPSIPVSSIPCGGCGALLHCQDPALPGYLPSELFKNQSKDILRSSTCQRCHFLKYYNTNLEVTVKSDDYPSLLSHIRGKMVAIILMVDLTDFPCSIWPGIKDIVHRRSRIFIVGNKVDLLPIDGPNCLKNVENSLLMAVKEAGIKESNIANISLVSAKTGYGVERFINKLHSIWEYKGNVYLIGCTNVGKSSLFNALLQSDYCKIQAADLVQRATTSPWPGTTLSTLKFPILNPVRKRLWERTQRLLAEQESTQDMNEYRRDMFKETGKIKYATLEGHVGKSFSAASRIEGHGYFGEISSANEHQSGHIGLDEKSKIYAYSRWCYDTPGAILPDQVLHLLTTEELLLTLPRHIITPRTFVLFKKQTLFVAGLGRLDFLLGSKSIKCTIFASHQLPITVCRTDVADEVYASLLKTEALVVPKNDPERLKLFPALESKDFEFTTSRNDVSSVDVVLSSAGWIALTGREERTLTIRVWTPEGKGIHLRAPAMLSRSVKLKGYRIPDSQAYTGGKRIYTKK